MYGNDESDPLNHAGQDADQILDSQQLQQKREQQHPNCFVCQPHRPFGLRLAYVSNPDGSVMAEMDCPKLWQGYPGMVHGGIIASILDGAMTHCLFTRDIAGFTADLHVRYRHPLLLSEPATVTAQLTRDMSPVYVLEAKIIQQEVIRCTATGKFMDSRYTQQTKVSS